jgi:hypothetical protein
MDFFRFLMIDNMHRSPCVHPVCYSRFKWTQQNDLAPTEAEKQAGRTGFRFSIVEVVLFFVVIVLIVYLLYFRDIDHFFQADTIYWLYHRATSWQDFFHGFLVRDVSDWYRPLGNRLIPFLFYGWFGMEPAGYRIVIAILFLIATAAVSVFLAMVTRSKVVVYAGTFYFVIHTVNAFVTYDASAAPELLSAIFCISSIMLFWLYCCRKRPFMLIASCLCYICGLWSKESAVVLPFVLVIVSVLNQEKGSLWKRIVTNFLGAKWHFLILMAYLAFAVGYLHVAGTRFDSLIKSPPPENRPNYRLVMGQSVLKNADYALSWAFNIPRSWTSKWQGLPERHIAFLRVFRLAVGILSLVILFSYRRRWFLLGMCWFVISLGPALLLREHFLPYYLFLPLSGISLVVGTTVDWSLQSLMRLNSWLRVPGLCFWTVAAAILLFVCQTSIQNERRNSPWLGRSSEVAAGSIHDLHTLFPNLKPNTTFYIINDEEPDLEWDTAEGGLFRLSYNDETLRVLFSSEKGMIPLGHGEALFILRYTNGHLRNETVEYRSHPHQFQQYLGRFVEGSYTLQLSTNTVEAGKDSYILEIPNLPNVKAQIYYDLNSGPMEEFTVRLDSQGQIKFDVSSDTPKGLYRFLAFRIEGSPELYKTDAEIIVR